MNQARWAGAGLLALLGAAAWMATIDRSPNPAFEVAPPPPKSELTAQRIGDMPMHFEPMAEGSESTTHYFSRGPGYVAAIESDGARLYLHHSARENKAPLPHAGEGLGRGKSESGTRSTEVRLELIGANPDATLTPLEPRAGYSNYLSGSDPSKWRQRVPHFGRVKAESVYPGIDVVYYGKGKKLEYDFVVAPGVDPSAISLRYQGVEALRVDGNGDLVLSLPEGELVQHKPIVYQERDGQRRMLDGRYQLSAEGEVRFALAPHDREVALVIDPVLNYSTYVGGSSSDEITEIALDGSGNIYALADCNGNCVNSIPEDRFLSTGSTGMYVAKFRPAVAGGVEVVYATFFGAANASGGIAVDSAGSAYVAAFTTETDYPTVPAQTPFGSSDVYVSKLTPDGTALVYSRVIGATGVEEAYDIALDAQNNAYVTGETSSSGFPITPGAFQETLAGGRDVFVTKLSANGAQILYSTFIGGSATDEAFAIAVDSSGRAHIGGATGQSNSFPLVNPIEPPDGGADSFVLRLNAAGTALEYSSVLTSANYGLEVDDIALDAAGALYAVGEGNNDLPGQTNSFDAFIAKITPAGGDGNFPVRYLGGTRSEDGAAIAVDAQGNVYVGGATQSIDFPRVDPLPGADGNIQATSTQEDAFVTKLSSNGTILFSSYISGEDDDFIYDLQVDGSGNIFAAGETRSDEFPLRDAFDTARGFEEGFLLRISEQTDAPSLQFVQSAFQVTEAGVMATLQVSRTGSSAGAVTVNFATAPGTATANQDYTSSSGNLTWPAGDTASKTIDVPIINDTLDENDESFSVTLSAPGGGAVIGMPSTANVNIIDDDAPSAQQTLAFSSASFTIGESQPSVTITVNRSGGTDGTVGVSYATAPGSATGADFSPASGILSFGPGEGSKTFVVPITGDALDESDETFSVQLSAPTGTVVLGTPSSATVTILDDDDAPAPGMPGALALSAASFTTGESAGSVTITVNRTGGSSGAVSVSYASVAGSATTPSDFNSASGSLSFADGETSKSFMVPIVNDSQSEGSETFSVQLSNPTGGASLGSPSTATVTIVDDDLAAAGTLALSSAAFSTIESGGNVTITVNRSGGSSGAVAVSYATAPGTATAGDFTAASGSVMFADGETSKTFTIGIVNDLINEPNESFSVSLSSPTNGASLGTPSTATVTIMDDDAGPAGALAFGAGAFNVNEAASALNVTVMRSGGSTGVVSVNFAAAIGSAGAADFTPAAGTLAFADGETSKSFAVATVNDSLDEPDESFTLQLSMPAGGASLGLPSSATVTIVDDDLPAPAPGIAACGPANGSTLPSFPSGGLCASGTSTTTDFFGSDGNFNWTCAANDGSAAPCSAINVNVASINGTCGPATAPAQPGEFPAAGHCAAGIFAGTDTEGRDGVYDWQCLGRNGGSSVACTAPVLNQGPAKGVCGAADGTGSASFPANGLCSSGVFQATDAIAADGRFNWSCSGFNGGQPAFCSSAKLGAPIPPGPGTGASSRSGSGGGSLEWFSVLVLAMAAMVRRRSCFWESTRLHRAGSKSVTSAKVSTRLFPRPTSPAAGAGRGSRSCPI